MAYTKSILLCRRSTLSTSQVALRDEKFVATLTAIIPYLRRQYNLISSMGLTCPKFMDSWWEDVRRCTSWRVEGMILLRNYLEDNNAARDPPLG